MRPLAQAQLLKLPVAGATLNAELVVPAGAHGLVLFAYASGTDRHGHRNQFLARVLQQSDIGTLLMNLLTEEEERVDHQTRQFRFDIDFLASRLVSLVNWAVQQGNLRSLPIGLFGANTGAAAALVAAARHPDLVKAVVSRGGRPDLAGDSLRKVQAPAMLVVGEYDDAVLVLNEQAKARMTGEVALRVVPRATHLFEEPGALAQVADYASAWFSGRLSVEG